MLDVAVKAPPSPPADAPQDTVVLVLLHHDGRFRLLERTLRDFQQLARQLGTENPILAAIEAYCDTKPSFYPPEQRGSRLSIALETFIGQLVANSEILTTSTALKAFLHADRLTTTEQSYRDAVQTAIASQEQEVELIQDRVAAGCLVEQQVAVSVDENGEKKILVWKFVSQGTKLVFGAQFSTGVKGSEDADVDPYSVSTNDVAEQVENEKEVVHYRTNCAFKVDGDDKGFLYGHYVAEKSGVVTLRWENVDMSTVVSKPLTFQMKVVPLVDAVKVVEVARELNAAETAEWLREYVDASEITSMDDLPGWGLDANEDGFGEDDAYEDGDVDPEQDSQIQSAVLEERTHELEKQVMHLEESLTATKRELKSALDRVQIAEEIYKANLETITQLECKTVGDAAQKTSRATHEAENTTAPLPVATIDLDGAQPEGTPSSELERVQKLCAGFQEQCLWRSVENMELEAQLAAAQVEASSWREKHVEQAAQLEEVEKQNRTLRAHKKMLVQEVKRLQPYSQVNLAALVQEAQEARMVQRSLQAKLDSHEQLTNDDTAGEPVETGPSDFVLVEASQDDP